MQEIVYILCICFSGVMLSLWRFGVVMPTYVRFTTWLPYSGRSATVAIHVRLMKNVLRSVNGFPSRVLTERNVGHSFDTSTKKLATISIANIQSALIKHIPIETVNKSNPQARSIIPLRNISHPRSPIIFTHQLPLLYTFTSWTCSTPCHC